MTEKNDSSTYLLITRGAEVVPLGCARVDVVKRACINRRFSFFLFDGCSIAHVRGVEETNREITDGNGEFDDWQELCLVIKPIAGATTLPFHPDCYVDAASWY